ncbi:MAG: NAD-dependent protein deacetylase [Polyangiaceae bacterium]|nr:NAD-dependent protein deacetylase [Polyangiaceae bacterium]
MQSDRLDGPSAWVPPRPGGASFDALVELLRGRRFVALTGAGCSTESGIPDYRGQGVPRRPNRPIQGPEFRRSEALRRRYWARSMEGWGRFQGAPPNAGHVAFARLEAAGHLSGIVTQNVDRLHHAAGSRRVIELHGALADVICLACGELEPRSEVQARLLELNPGWGAAEAAMAPDGDAELPPERLAAFRPADCVRCAGALMPRVVFFGDNVPRPVVDDAFRLVDEAEVLLVAGSSLAVFSGYRFLLHAKKRGTPVAIVNLGPVRGEEHAAVKIEAATGEVLPQLYEALARG